MLREPVGSLTHGRDDDAYMIGRAQQPLKFYRKEARKGTGK